MKKSVLLLVCILPLLALCQEKMVQRRINEEISYMVPASFVLMGSKDRMKKFVATKEPLAMYSNEDREVDFGVNWNQMQWATGEDETIYGFYKASIQSLFDNVEFVQDEIKEINGQSFIVYEFVSSLKSDNTFSGPKTSSYYTYIQYTSYNNQVLLFSFRCKAHFMRQWQPIAKEIMNSVKVDEK